MIGSVIVGTALTLVFVPALDVTWLRIDKEKAEVPTEVPSA